MAEPNHTPTLTEGRLDYARDHLEELGILLAALHHLIRHRQPSEKTDDALLVLGQVLIPLVCRMLDLSIRAIYRDPGVGMFETWAQDLARGYQGQD